MEWGGLWWLIDRYPSGIGLWNTEEFGGSFPFSLPVLGSFRDVVTAAPCGPEDSPVAAFCGLSPQRNLMNCCSLTWAGRGNPLRPHLHAETLATHACHAPALAWRGCCFLSPGSLNTETIWWLLGGGGLPEGQQNDSKTADLTWFLFTNLF